MGKLTEQFFDMPERYRDKTRQRIYLKDIDCPSVWQDKLKEHIPSGLFYLNESTGEIGGPGALDEAGGRKGRGIARAGDLMSSLPPEMRAENLMCYIGHEGTYTPAHREMCASLGQNIMVNASSNIGEDGNPERPGSSIWFMTETKDRQVVSEYWLSVLGHDIEVENHFAQLIAWKKAPFRTYVVEQRPGDFILIPPLAPHQVWNRGTRTVKIAWNRTTVETLEHAINEALPNSRVVCRDEQYKNKAIIYYTLLKYSNLIKSARAQVELGGEQADAIQLSVKVRQVQRDFKRLFDLYKSILLSEMFLPDSREHPDFEPYDSNVTCAYCRCNIFNRFLTCKACKHAFSQEIEEPYDVCMDCYAMGRSCACQSGYTWVEQWKWKDLIHKYEEWRAQIIDIDGHMTEKTPLPLQEERRYLGKKTLAQVCKEQLKVRPFIEPNAPKSVEKQSDEEIEVDEEGFPKKAKKKSKQWLSEHKSCHFCLHRHPKWKMAFCTNCDLAYCYGTLFRAHDMMPLVVMENPTWKCPHCRRTCNTGNCRRDPRQHPYEPKGTLLGHDTKKVADPRSVECLVDFSVSNLNWIREDEPTGQYNGPMQRRRNEAERAKLDDPTMDDRYRDQDPEHSRRNSITYSPVEESNAGFADDAGGSGFVDPSAVMYQNDAIVQDDSLNLDYPGPDDNGEIPRLGKRNRDGSEEDANPRRKKKQQKKKKEGLSQPAAPKNESGKQYQKEVQKKLLDEAKKEDRFIIVAARMKGKSKVVKLRLDSDLLEVIDQRVVSERAQVQRQESTEAVEGSLSILESDILPQTNAVNKPDENPKAPTSFRVPVDEDESYGTRRRDRETNGAGKTGWPSHKRRRFEELTLESDQEGEEEEMVEYIGPSKGRPKGRSSAWLARKNEGEEDLPTELPPNFKDGALNPRSGRDRERGKERRGQRKTVPARPKPKPGTRPPGRPPTKNAGNMLEEDDVHNDDDDAESAFILAQSAAVALESSRKAEEVRLRAEVAQREAEENLRAKMALFDEGSGDAALNGYIDDFAAEDEPLHERVEPKNKTSPVISRTGPPQSENSIFSRPGMSGKKIKIISSAKKHKDEGLSTKVTTATTATTIKAPVPSFTTVNRKITGNTINLSDDSDSDSEDEIPAKAPQPKLPVGRLSGRPVGRPSLASTRGGSNTAKRGRGRPRKTM